MRLQKQQRLNGLYNDIEVFNVLSGHDMSFSHSIFAIPGAVA